MGALISVIVPVYNGQDCLINCIESIQQQTYPDKEIILVDDGSTDHTGEICRDLLERYDNIRLISLKDEGVSVARNAGIEKSGGEYLMFVDADDRLCPQMIQSLYDALIRTSSDVAGCGFFSWGNEEEWEGMGRKAEEGDSRGLCIFQRDELFEQVVEGKDTRCWAKLYKRKIIGEHRFRQGLTIGEDMLFLLDILPDVRKVVTIDWKGYGYYRNPIGAMNRKFTPAYMDQITCWEMARDLAVQMDYSMRVRATERLLVAIILVAGKLAFLSGAERGAHGDEIQVCLEKLRENLQVKGAYERLPKGYKRKIKLFTKAPGFYLWLYHFRKYLK